MDAAARQIASEGAAALALRDVARDAGVSKALIHYHFTDKDTLLARLIENRASAVVRREREALRAYEHEHSPLAVDALWAWLESELRRGDIRVLLELDSHHAEAVQSAARAAAARRQLAAQETVQRLFGILELRPRIEPSLLATVVVAFIDGLVIRSAFAAHDERATTTRVAFDVFWLAMLSLAE